MLILLILSLFVGQTYIRIAVRLEDHRHAFAQKLRPLEFITVHYNITNHNIELTKRQVIANIKHLTSNYLKTVLKPNIKAITTDQNQQEQQNQSYSDKSLTDHPTLKSHCR